jgi:hypothetical protein
MIYIINEPCRKRSASATTPPGKEEDSATSIYVLSIHLKGAIKPPTKEIAYKAPRRNVSNQSTARRTCFDINVDSMKPLEFAIRTLQRAPEALQCHPNSTWRFQLIDHGHLLQRAC